MVMVATISTIKSITGIELYLTTKSHLFHRHILGNWDLEWIALEKMKNVKFITVLRGKCLDEVPKFPQSTNDENHWHYLWGIWGDDFINVHLNI